MSKFTNLLQINGKPMLAPDELTETYTDFDSDESGRDEGGYMHRIIAREKVATWSFSYSHITEEEMRYMENLFANNPDFEFTHPSRLVLGEKVTTRCYRSNYKISLKNALQGLYSNYSFNIIEC